MTTDITRDLTDAYGDRIAKTVTHHACHGNGGHGTGASADSELTQRVIEELRRFKYDEDTELVYSRDVAERTPYSPRQVGSAMRTLRRRGDIEKWSGKASKWVIKL